MQIERNAKYLKQDIKWECKCSRLDRAISIHFAGMELNVG